MGRDFNTMRPHQQFDTKSYQNKNHQRGNGTFDLARRN